MKSADSTPLAWRPAAWLVLQLQLLALAIGSAVFNLGAFLLYPLLGRETGRRLGRRAISRGYNGYWALIRPVRMLRLQLQALDALAERPGLVIVANHPSLLDAMLLVARLPRSACVMKAGLMRNPFLAAGALLARYIPNDSAHTMAASVSGANQSHRMEALTAGLRFCFATGCVGNSVRAEVSVAHCLLPRLRSSG